MVKKIVSGILLMGLIVVMSVVLWGLNKGFDFTDTGFHVMLLKHPEESPPFWQYQWFFQHFLGWLNLEILGIKIVRFVLTIISSWILTWGFWHWIQENKFFQNFSFNKLAVFSFITIGSFVSYSLQPTTLSYNTFVLICMEIVMGLVLYGITKVPLKGEGKTLMTPARYALFVSAGAVIGIMFFAKFTTAILFAVSLALLYIFIRINRGNIEFIKMISELGLVALGGCLVLLYYHLFIQSFPSWVEQIFAYQKVYPDHDMIEILEKYQRSSVSALRRSVVRLFEIPLILAGMFGFYRYYTNKNKETENLEKADKWLLGGYVFMLFYILVNASRFNWYYSGMFYNQTANNIYVLLLFTVVGIMLVHTNRHRIRRLIKSPYMREAFLVGFSFLLLPVVAAAGNNNPITLQGMGYLFAWFIAFLILFQGLEKLTNRAYVPLFMSCILGLFGVAQTINGYVYNPQRVNGTLWQQTEQVEGFDMIKPMRVDVKTKYFIKEIEDILKNKTTFEMGDPLIALSKMPGLIYVLNGMSPTNTWTHSDYHKLNCYHVENTKLTNLEKTILIMEKGTELNDTIQTCFNDKGILYPSNYVNIGDIQRFDDREEKVSIFAPIPIIKEGAL